MTAKMNCNYAMADRINVWVNCYEINFQLPYVPAYLSSQHI